MAMSGEFYFFFPIPLSSSALGPPVDLLEGKFHSFILKKKVKLQLCTVFVRRSMNSCLVDFSESSGNT